MNEYQPTARIRFREDSPALSGAGIFRQVQGIAPQDGSNGGYLYVSSPDAFAQWRVTTWQDTRSVIWSTRSGPASWSRYYIQSGCKIDVSVRENSILAVDPLSGLVTAGAAAPAIEYWYLPFDDAPVNDDFHFSFGPDPLCDFPALAAGVVTRLGYCPRLCRALYLKFRGNIVVQAGMNYSGTGFFQNAYTDRAAIYASEWDSFQLLSTPGSTCLGAWSNANVEVLG